MILETSMEKLFVNLLYSVALGFLIGIIYDIFRIFKITLGAFGAERKKHFNSLYDKGIKRVIKSNGGKVYSYIITAFCDVMFFLLFAAVFSVFLFAFNYGIFRWFLLIGCIIGFRLYYISLGKAVITVSELAADFITLVLNCFLSLVLLPLNYLFEFIEAETIKFLLPFLQKRFESIDRYKLKRYTLKCIDKLENEVRFH